MDDRERENKELALDKKEMELARVRMGAKEYQFKIREREREIRRLGRDLEAQEKTAARLEQEVIKMREDLSNG